MCNPLDRTTTRSLSSPNAVERNHRAPSSSKIAPDLRNRSTAASISPFAASSDSRKNESNRTPNRSRVASIWGSTRATPSARMRRNRSSARQVRETGPSLSQDVPRELLHVGAVVSVVGHLGVAPHELQEPRLDRRAEPIHLPARVVEVVLALDGPSGRVEQARERVADRRVASVPERQRPRRVGAHELDLHAPSVRLDPAVRRAAIRDVAQRLVQPVVGREQVQETGPRHLGPLEEGRLRQRVGDRLRDLARWASGSRGEPQRHVRGEVAVLTLLGNEQLGRRQIAVDAERRSRPFERLGGADP